MYDDRFAKNDYDNNLAKAEPVYEKSRGNFTVSYYSELFFVATSTMQSHVIMIIML